MWNFVNTKLIQRFEFARFILVGIFNTIFDYSVYFSLTRFFGVYYLIANVISVGLNIIIAYEFNKRWTFKNQEARSSQQFIRFVLVSLGGLAINEGILFILVHFGVWDLLAKAIAIIGIVVWNFTLHKFWTFRERNVKIDFFQNSFSKILLTLFSLGFFVFYGFLNIAAPRIFNSPDEAVNFWVAERIAKGKSLVLELPRHLAGYQKIEPRSMFLGEFSSSQKALLPSSFLGMPILYGKIARLFHTLGVISWLTPLFALLGAWALYYLARIVFDRRIAFFSLLLYLTIPPVLHYTARGMFHNVLFTSLFLMGIASLFALASNPPFTKGGNPPFTPPLNKGGKGGLILASFLFLTLALWVRPAEAVWIWFGLAGCVFILRDKLSLRYSIIPLILLPPAVVLYFWLQKKLLGSLLVGGYSQVADGNILKWFFPFGFNPEALLFNIQNYGFWFLWWLAIPALIGYAAIIIKKNKNSFERAYLGLVSTTAIFLVFFVYGNWLTFDNPNLEIISIGNAHVRYWLPLFALAIPIALFAVFRLLKVLPRLLSIAAASLLIGGAVYFSYFQTFHGEDGFISVFYALQDGQYLRDEISKIASNDDLIIVDREDKYLFPEFWTTRFWDFEGIKRIHEYGAEVYFLTNNDLKAVELYKNKIERHGFALKDPKMIEWRILWRLQSE